MNRLMNTKYIGNCTACIRKSIATSAVLVCILMVNSFVIGSRPLFLLLLPIAAASIALSLAHLWTFSYRVGTKKLSVERHAAETTNLGRRLLFGRMIRYGSLAAASMVISSMSPKLALAFDNICGAGSGNAINCGDNICCYDSQENEYYCCNYGTVCVGATSTSGRGCRGA